MTPARDLDRWFRCRDYIRAALEYGGDTHKEGDVALGIQEGRYQFWPGEKSAVVTQIVRYPNFRSVRIWLAGGDLEELLATERLIAAWAKDIGAKRIEIGGGRPGWERALKGYQKLCPCAVKGL